MKSRTIGNTSIGAIGLGCMGMSWAYGAPNNEESHRVLERALELGVNHWDTADLYGAGANEVLLAPILAKHRDKVFLATKFGNVYDRSLTSHQDLVEQNAGWIVDGTPRYLRARCEDSLRRLGVDAIDLYYQHRVDPRVPIEETWGEMKRLVEEGKVRNLGISEASAESLRKAHAVHPVAAIQSEYSLWTRDPEAEILPTCRELGIKFVAYSPLGRGFLTGTIQSVDDLPQEDWRRSNPRFQEEALAENLRIADKVKEVAARHGASPAQVALAWLLAEGEYIVPIPGTKRVKYLEDNAGAASVELSSDDIAMLNSIQPPVGTRYPEAMMGTLNR
ncbi:MAG: aldo/keto reductase [Armatimonadetes bacterium]|nr:aldo/keto reductase [Armatimonadota bacterium]